jgi:hypothetical protein
MIIESPEDMAKYLKLKEKDELKENSNVKESSHSRIMKLFTRKKPIEEIEVLPQGIPLRSKFSNGKPIPKTAENYKKWRKLIFDTKGNFEEFELVNKDGKQYSSKVYYIKCHIDTVSYMLDNKWYSLYESQKPVIKQIQKNPNKFEYNIIVKNANCGHNFLMLHCKIKEN